MTATHATQATACPTCESLRRTPPTATELRGLLAHVESADSFELFGLPRTYRIDLADLNSAYLAISRNIHPDRFASADASMQLFALRASATVNRACDMLKDAFRRAEYLLETSGGKSAAQDKRVPPELLDQVMMLQEELDEARTEGDTKRIAGMRVIVLEQRREAQAAVGELCDRLGDASEEVRDELRLRLNALKYLNNLLATIDAT